MVEYAKHFVATAQQIITWPNPGEGDEGEMEDDNNPGDSIMLIPFSFKGMIET